jgi:hypothetical protein
MRCMPPEVIGDGQSDVCVPAGLKHRSTRLQIGRHGLFYQRVFPGAGRSDRLFGMQFVRTGDDDSIQIGIRQQGVHIIVGEIWCAGMVPFPEFTGST